METKIKTNKVIKEIKVIRQNNIRRTTRDLNEEGCKLRVSWNGTSLSMIRVTNNLFLQVTQSVRTETLCDGSGHSWVEVVESSSKIKYFQQYTFVDYIWRVQTEK